MTWYPLSQNASTFSEFDGSPGPTPQKSYSRLSSHPIERMLLKGSLSKNSSLACNPPVPNWDWKDRNRRTSASLPSSVWAASTMELFSVTSEKRRKHSHFLFEAWHANHQISQGEAQKKVLKTVSNHPLLGFASSTFSSFSSTSFSSLMSSLTSSLISSLMSSLISWNHSVNRRFVSVLVSDLTHSISKPQGLKECLQEKRIKTNPPKMPSPMHRLRSRSKSYSRRKNVHPAPQASLQRSFPPFLLPSRTSRELCEWRPKLNRRPVEFPNKATNLSVSAFSDSLGPRELRLSGENVNLLKKLPAASRKQQLFLLSCIKWRWKWTHSTHTIGSQTEKNRFFHFCLTEFAILQRHPNMPKPQNIFSTSSDPVRVQTLSTNECSVHSWSWLRWSNRYTISISSISSMSSISFSYLICSSSFVDSLCLSQCLCWLIPASDAQQTQRDAMESHTSGYSRKQRKNWICQSCNQCPLTSPLKILLLLTGVPWHFFWRSCWCGLRDVRLTTVVKCRKKKQSTTPFF